MLSRGNFRYLVASTAVSFLLQLPVLVSLSMDRRHSPRVNVVLPVRIWGVDAYSLPFTQQATVRNISSDGAVLHGIRRQLRPGEVLEMQYERGKAQFRVVWVGDFGSAEQDEIGLQALPAEPVLWDVNLSQCCELVAQG